MISYQIIIFIILCLNCSVHAISSDSSSVSESPASKSSELMFGVSLNFDKQGPDNPKIQQMLDNHLFYIWPLTRPVLEKTRESVQQILPRFPSSKVLVAVFNHKISDFCNSTSVLIEKPEPYSLPTVSHMCASLCSCSILSCSILSCSFLSCSFLCASSAYHALKIYGEQDWLMRSRHH